ncbi:MAG: FRG domain-containing protein [Balneola sp.]
MRQILGNLTKELKKHTSPKEVGKDAGYPVTTFRKLVEQVAKLSYLNKDYLLFFRGQKNDYLNKANSSTFYPTIYRGDYVSQQELDFRFDKLESASKILSHLFETNKIQGQYELRRKKYIQWSILQHYEVTETPLIDLTQSLRVACSFAQLWNDQTTAFVYVFGLPYYTNRISTNSEHDLVNVRLLSITPPEALRPYFQEGFLVGTEDLTNEYDNKSELDLNNRLFAKFEIPNNDSFWGKDFKKIPETALYPKNDRIESICKEIGQEISVDLTPSELGRFLKIWTNFEQRIIKQAREYKRNVFTTRDAINTLKWNSGDQNIYNAMVQLDSLRNFRNRLVHNPTEISKQALNTNLVGLENLWDTYNKNNP